MSEIIAKELPSNLKKEVKKDERGLVSKLTDWYFKPKSFEKSGKLYENLGMEYFKKAVISLKPKKGREKASNYFIGKERKKANLRTFESYTRLNEMIHLAPLSLLYQAIPDLTDEKVIIKGTAVALGLLATLYCIMLQRYNRARLYNTLEKMEQRGKA